MNYPQNVWDQLNNTTVEKLMKTLQKDGWEKGNPTGARIPYRKAMDNGEVRRVVIHYHTKKTYGQRTAQGHWGVSRRSKKVKTHWLKREWKNLEGFDEVCQLGLRKELSTRIYNSQWINQ